jgi:hypothetical protein
MKRSLVLLLLLSLLAACGPNGSNPPVGEGTWNDAVWNESTWQ